MSKKRSLASHFSASILSLLFGFFIFVVAATSIMQFERLEEQLKEELHIEAFNKLNLFNVELNSLRQVVFRMASSQLSINGLIDLNHSYFHHSLDDLSLFTSVNDAVVFDYAGEYLFGDYQSPPTWYKTSLINQTLSTNQRALLFKNGYFFIVEPILYYGSMQGGIIARVNTKDMVNQVFKKTSYSFSVLIGNNWEYSNNNLAPDGITLKMAAPASMDISEFSTSISLVEPYSHLFKGIYPWLFSFTLLGLIGLLPVIFIAQRIGRKMAKPITRLADNISEGNYPVTSDSNAQEIEDLAIAFNLAHEELINANMIKIEAERRSGQSKLVAIVDTVVDGIVTITEQGNIVTFNPAAETLFGYKEHEVIGKNVKILMTSKDSHAHDTYLTNYLNGKPAQIIGIGREVVAQRADGSTFPADLSISEMHVSGERMFTGIIRDITLRKKDEQLKNEFVATVSHELRTPLTSIRGALGLVLGKFDGQLPAKSKTMLSMALRNCERLTTLINDILDIEKLESEQMSLELVETNLDNIIRRSIEDNEGFANHHGVSLCYLPSPTGAFVYADSGRLQQVMANLLSNAIKYSDRGSSVTISLRRQDDSYRVDVCDEGTGISPEFHARIFERFSQADSSDTRKRGGTGLGLAISRTIIESHHGEIDFFSTVGKGSTFFFKLPIPSKNLSTLGHTEHTGSTFKKETPLYQVLVIDADKSVFNEIKEPLSEFCKLLFVSSKGAAKIALHNQNFDLIIMDWVLKGDDISGLLDENIFSNTHVILLGDNLPNFRLPACVAATHQKSQLNTNALKSEVRLILKIRNTREAM
ncbi:PAS domain S-box protein [Enterovibrio sp. ZSDZ35]|uniref:histidine kinase n=1 Tax=Enterovibrio qingdaonensis TaxID=2899818 RepID=A0ABT5QSZ4_9GAMM|nr:ATP-binding protein [Enterovibrio sp. ZSDZ35]MDD1784102.1 PAS domain S-box protein [Enterovibrio sp. ZSDZ35]